jgi:hypothetical protein
MGFVNRKQRELPFPIQAVQQGKKAVCEQTFRGDINQIQLAIEHFLFGGTGGGVIH